MFQETIPKATWKRELKINKRKKMREREPPLWMDVLLIYLEEKLSSCDSREKDFEWCLS